MKTTGIDSDYTHDNKENNEKNDNKDDDNKDDDDKDDDDDDDDDDIILISSTRQKWEKLHGIHGPGTIQPKRSNNQGSKDDSRSDGATQIPTNDEDDGEEEEEEEEDEIVVVTVRPTRQAFDNDSNSCGRFLSIYELIQRRCFGVGIGVGIGIPIDGPCSDPNAAPFRLVLTLTLTLLLAVALSIGIQRWSLHRRRKNRRRASKPILVSEAAVVIDQPQPQQSQQQQPRHQQQSGGRPIVETPNTTTILSGSKAGAENEVEGESEGDDNENDNHPATTVIARLAEPIATANRGGGMDGVLQQSPSDLQLSLHSSGGERAPNGGLGGHCDEAAAETVAAAAAAAGTSPIGTPQTADNGVAPLAKTQQRREAEQFARDMQQARDVLGLDSSAAALFVQSLRLEKNLENLWMQTTFLSEKRHRQSLRAARHDPNWLEKFHALRDQSYYWNLAGGGSGGRLLWEVIAIQQLARGILPVWQYYYYHSSDTETVLGNINSNSNGNGNSNNNNNNNNSEQFDRWIASFLRDSVASILAQVCDCGTRTGSGPSVSAAAATTTAAAAATAATTTSHAQSTMFSWMMTIMTMTTTMIPTTTTMTTTTTTSSSSSSSTVVSLLPGFLEHWSCYGYCVLSASTLLVSTIALHHGLRLLSVPSSVHHFVNLASVALIYGPHRTLSLVFATVARTVVALHIPLSLPIPSGSSSSSSSTILSENDSHGNSHIRLGCSILLVSHWVILPLVSWIRITTLCRSVESRANDSDSVHVDVDVDLDFENTLREGRDQLKRWKREQTTLRYLLLSVYSALVLWENSRIDNTVVRVVDS